MAGHRRLWRVWQRFMDPDCFVFLDETGASTNMVRRYGWAPRSERLVAAAPHGHWRTTTFVAGLRSTGLVAPLVLDGPMTGPAFLAYVEQCLAPTLRPGDVVVMDNLPAHKVAGVEAALRAAGTSILYRPPYSPDLNPIEQVSPSSRPCSAALPPEPERRFAPPSGSCSVASALPSAATTSLTQDMSSRNAKMV